MQRLEGDRISSLPDNVREHILMLLSLKEAARASLLSTRWRNMWTRFPTLVIDDSFCEALEPGSDFNDNRVKAMERSTMFDICRVLMRHRGPLRVFYISLPRFASRIDQILLFLPFQNIESLTVEAGDSSNVEPENFCVLPRCLFSSFSQLMTLRLACCTFGFSHVSFEGFNRLRVLDLKHFKFQGTPAQLRISCPSLTTLTLENEYEYPLTLSEHPDIVIEESPKLFSLQLIGQCESLQFKYTPVLKTVAFFTMNVSPKVQLCRSNYLRISGGLAEVEYLCVNDGFLMCLAIEEPPYLRGSNQKPWEKLSCIKLCTTLACPWFEATSLVAVINNSPNLRKFVITVLEADREFDEDEAVAITESGVAASRYELLTTVKVKSVTGRKVEMALISWLLNSSPALGMMKIQLSDKLSDADKLSVVMELHRFPRASSRAQIVVN